MIWGSSQCQREEQKSEIRGLAASEMIWPGIAMFSCVPALGIWGEYQNILLNQTFFEVLPKRFYGSKSNEEKKAVLILGFLVTLVPASVTDLS